MMMKFLITFTILLLGTGIYAQDKEQKPFSSFREANGILYLSGQTGMPAKDFDQEVSRAFENIKVVLASAGSSLDKVITVNVYLTDLGQYEKFNSLYKKYFRPPFPSRTCIGARDLPLQASVEITVTAMK